MKTLRKYRKILAAMFLIGIAGALYTWFFVYNKPHPDYEKLAAEHHFESKALFEQYRSDKAAADSHITGRMVSINGHVDQIEQNGEQTILVFVFDNGMFGDEGIRCTLLDNYRTLAEGLEPGNQVKVKGYCTGYNETDVILEKCTIQKI